MKKQKKNKINRNGLSYSVSETLIPAIILSIFAVLMVILMISKILPLFSSDKVEDSNIEDTLWEQAYLEAEKNKVGIEFKPITTDEESYEILRSKCNDYIEKSIPDQSEHLDANIDVDTVVNEQQFIDDNEELKDTSNEKVDQNLAETGPVYFQDMLMLRYINTDGKLVVVIGLYDNDGNVIITRQDELLNTLSRIDKYDSSWLNKDNEVKSIEESSMSQIKENSLLIYEDEYLKDLSDTLESMFTAYSKEEIEEAEIKALKFFTFDGKETVFGNRDEIKLDEEAKVETVYMQVGKSNYNKGYKDRIYTQLKVSIGDKSTMVNIILKLNNNLRIYDIDLI